MRRMMSRHWSQGTFSRLTVTDPETSGSTTTFSPVIFAKVRRTSLMSASFSSREIGSPVKCATWLSTSLRARDHVDRLPGLLGHRRLRGGPRRVGGAAPASAARAGGAVSAAPRRARCWGPGSFTIVTGVGRGLDHLLRDLRPRPGSRPAGSPAAGGTAWATSTGGGAGAEATASGAAAGSPPTRSSAPCDVGSTRYGSCSSRSTTTLTTGSGAVANWATRTCLTPRGPHRVHAPAHPVDGTLEVDDDAGRVLEGEGLGLEGAAGRSAAPRRRCCPPPRARRPAPRARAPARAGRGFSTRTSTPDGKPLTVMLASGSASTRRRAHCRPPSSTVESVAPPQARRGLVDRRAAGSPGSPRGTPAARHPAPAASW